jgi:hypothetical protein
MQAQCLSVLPGVNRVLACRRSVPIKGTERRRQPMVRSNQTLRVWATQRRFSTLTGRQGNQELVSPITG